MEAGSRIQMWGLLLWAPALTPTRRHWRTCLHIVPVLNRKAEIFIYSLLGLSSLASLGHSAPRLSKFPWDQKTPEN